MKRAYSIKRASIAATAAVGVLFVTFAFPALAHDSEHHTAIPVDNVVFNPGPPTLPAGAEIAVLMGSPAEPGPFVIRLKFPAGYEIPPHRHPQEEHVTVLSGGFGMATGETHDRAAAPLLAAGSFVRIPVGEAHYAWTQEETIVQLNGIGPFGVEYVDPMDDPRAQ
ncbi:cupin domain-containing protein [Devosia nitrariae]|uniref:Cupin n=1 Tax=Devosia nitrariae TaxID=2071872 RepID=A0ABQ5W1X3_9HYPH|nr:cupin domain-containing protein [Devosia nitrariae]GLQ54013.1 cupin [Devosia nitrariae]